MKKIKNYLPFFVLFLLPLLLYPSVDRSVWISNSDIHAFLEFAASLLAITAGIMVLLHFLATGRWFFLIISIGFVLIGAEEFVHAIFSFEKIWSETLPTFKLAISSTWLTGRFILVTSLFIALIFREREIVPAKRGLYAVACNSIGLIFAAFVTLLIFNSPHIPAFVQLGSITKKLIELSLALLFFVAFLFYSSIYFKQQPHSPLLWSIIACIIFQVLVHIFVFDSRAFYDSHWDTAHLIVCLSYFFPIFGVWGETIKLHKYAQVQVIELEKEMTERKQAEEALRESEKKYRNILESMNDSYFETDLRGNMTFCNPMVPKSLGYSPEEMAGMNHRVYMDPENAEIAERNFRDIYRDNIPSKVISYEVTRKDRTKAHVETSFSLIKNKDGRPIGYRGVSRDITERKQAEEELRQAEEKYRSIFENAQEGIFRSTPEGRMIMANQAMANILGYDSPEEVIAGMTDIVRQLYVHPEERTKIMATIEEQGFIKNYETQLYRKDGSIFWVSLTMHAARDEKGQILYYEGMDEDITNRKESAERMRKALGATVQAIAVTVETRDPYTAGHQRRVANLARAIATEMNLPTDQIDGIRMAAVIHDLGKISVPAEILSKPSALTDLEFGIIKTHAQSGHDILKDIEFPWPIARMVLEHHERMDGSGYPRNLKGDDILMEARILAVSDVVEAIGSHRPYRPSLGIDAALEEIENKRGTHYDTSTVDACLRIFREKGYQLKET